MPTLILVLIILFVVLGAITLVVIGLRDRRESDPLQQRLAEFATRGETATLEEIELSQPISDRVIIPMARRIGELVSRITPQNAFKPQLIGWNWWAAQAAWTQPSSGL